MTRESDAKKRILARRARFMAAAIAATGIACAKVEEGPPSDAAIVDAQPEGCLSPPWDSGAEPCLGAPYEDTGPSVCLEPEYDSGPEPCLDPAWDSGVFDTDAEPSVCLKMAPDSTTD
ncbi:MAG: hypothetical protein HYV09_30015 [Deltaproteobacteria bacterium]|nr:hypothetical protein [Deltaproteobacteria bacterium]